MGGCSGIVGVGEGVLEWIYKLQGIIEVRKMEGRGGGYKGNGQESVACG